MTDNGPQCCGRPMRGIGVQREDGVLLHSCSSCGRHAWSAHGRELGRDELIAMLRENPPAVAAEPAPPTPRTASQPRSSSRPPSRTRPAPRPAAEPDRRTELQDLLRGFTVHGSSS